MLWLDEQTQILKEIDLTWVQIQETISAKGAGNGPAQRRLYTNWFTHLCHIYEELKEQQHWDPSSPRRKRLLDFLKSYRIIKPRYPAFSPIWGDKNPVWSLSTPVHCTTLYGFELYLSGSDFWSVAATGHYQQELNESLLIMRLLPHVDLFVDVGANIVFYSLMAARVSRESLCVVAFEPERQNYGKLELAIQSNDLGAKIRAFPMAIGSKMQRLRLQLSSSGSGGHSAAPPENIQMSEECEIVESTTLDEVQKTQFPQRPRTLIKLDVEGFEYEALCGAENWLAVPQAPIILFEAGTGRKSRHASEDHVIAIKKLRSFGYRVYPVLQPVNGKTPLGKECAPFRYKSPTINYLALPPHASNLISSLSAPIDLRLFTRREHLRSLLTFFINSLYSLEQE